MKRRSSSPGRSALLPALATRPRARTLSVRLTRGSTRIVARLSGGIGSAGPPATSAEGCPPSSLRQPTGHGSRDDPRRPRHTEPEPGGVPPRGATDPRRSTAWSRPQQGGRSAQGVDQGSDREPLRGTTKISDAQDRGSERRHPEDERDRDETEESPDAGQGAHRPIHRPCAAYPFRNRLASAECPRRPGPVERREREGRKARVRPRLPSCPESLGTLGPPSTRPSGPCPPQAAG